MAIWFSNSSAPLPICTIGNGTLSIWTEGVSFYSVRAGYTSPHVCSLSPDFSGGYYELETFPATDASVGRYRLFYSSAVLEMHTRTICDLQIVDRLMTEDSALIRSLDGSSSLDWRLNIPGYVKTVYHPSYRFGRNRASALFLTVPAGTPFENNYATMREQNLVIILWGALNYNPAEQSVRYGGDLGAFCFLPFDDPVDMIHKADRLLDLVYDFGMTPFYAAEVENETSQDHHRLAPIEAMQSREGAVIASHREPFSCAADLPALTELLLDSDRSDAALQMLLYWTAEQRFAAPRVRCDGVECNVALPDAASVASYLLAATRYMMRDNPTGKEGDLLFRGMRSALSLLMKEFREGMLPFSTRTAAFDAGLLGRELLFQGSSEVTALGIRACKEFFAYCQAGGKRAAKDADGYRKTLIEAETYFEKNFSHNGSIARNAPRRETLLRRPRFIRGVCTLCQREGAYPFEDTLELDKYGRYLCRRCFATRRGTPEETDPAKREFSPRADLIAALTVDSKTALANVPTIALAYARRLQEPKAALPLREADTDPLLLLTLKRKRTELCALLQADENALATLSETAGTLGFVPRIGARMTPEGLLDYLTNSVRTILEKEAEGDTLPALLCDTAPLGARHTAGATALYLLVTK